MFQLETHPALHYALELACYHVGLLANVLAGAHIATHSKINALKTIGQYFELRAIPLFVRWIACLAVFLIAWENPKVLNIDRFFTSLPQHLGMALSTGFLSDAFFNQVIGVIFPGVQKELPAIPLDTPNVSPNPPGS